MFTKGQLNRVLKWEKPWQIYLHARMAPTWPLLEEQNTEKRQQASLAYMQKTCDVAEKAILAKKNLRKKCVNRDKM